MKTGELLRKLRAKRRMTLKAVAIPAHISVQYLSEIERGSRQASADVIARLIPALGLAVDEIEDVIRAARDERTAALDDLLDREYKRIFPCEVTP